MNLSPFAQKAILTTISTIGTVVLVDLLLGGTIKNYVHGRQVIKLQKMENKHEEKMAKIQAADSE